MQNKDPEAIAAAAAAVAHLNLTEDLAATTVSLTARRQALWKNMAAQFQLTVSNADVNAPLPEELPPLAEEMKNRTMLKSVHQRPYRSAEERIAALTHNEIIAAALEQKMEYLNNGTQFHFTEIIAILDPFLIEMVDIGRGAYCPPQVVAGLKKDHDEWKKVIDELAAMTRRLPVDYDPKDFKPERFGRFDDRTEEVGKMLAAAKWQNNIQVAAMYNEIARHNAEDKPEVTAFLGAVCNGGAGGPPGGPPGGGHGFNINWSKNGWCIAQWILIQRCMRMAARSPLLNPATYQWKVYLTEEVLAMFQDGLDRPMELRKVETDFYDRNSGVWGQGRTVLDWDIANPGPAPHMLDPAPGVPRPNLNRPQDFYTATPAHGFATAVGVFVSDGKWSRGNEPQLGTPGGDGLNSQGFCRFGVSVVHDRPGVNRSRQDPLWQDKYNDPPILTGAGWFDNAPTFSDKWNHNQMDMPENGVSDPAKHRGNMHLMLGQQTIEVIGLGAAVCCALYTPERWKAGRQAWSTRPNSSQTP